MRMHPGAAWFTTRNLAMAASLAALWACQPAGSGDRPLPTELPADSRGDNIGASGPIVPTVPPRRATGEMVSEPLLYAAPGGGRVLGHLARRADPGTAPVLLLFHDERGIDSWLEGRAAQYATMGYVAVCPDLSELPADALDHQVVEHVQAAIGAAEDAMRRHPPVARYGAIGFGAGAGRALALARRWNLEALIVCHGDLIADEESLLAVREPVLGLFGQNDPGLPREEIDAFDQAMRRTGGTFVAYIWSDEGADFLRRPADETNVREANLEIVKWLDRFFVP